MFEAWELDLLAETALKSGGFCSLLGSNMLMGASGAAGVGYLINQSIRYNDDDSPKMTWTPGVAQDNADIGTYYANIKRGNLGSIQQIYNAGSGCEIQINASDKLVITTEGSGSLISTQVFRDPGAHGMLVVAWDTTQATGSNRIKVYWNDTQITAWDTETYPTINTDLSFFKNAQLQTIGANESGTEEFDGLFSDIHGCDGTQYANTDFGEYDENGVNWVPKAFAGSYGTNGFHIDGADSADFGNDVSGNANDFTTSGLTTADQVTDSPTDDADNGISNFCALSPIDNSVATLSEANTRALFSSGWKSVRTTMPIPDGLKVYAEATVRAGVGTAMWGVISNEKNIDSLTWIGAETDGWGWQSAEKWNSNSNTAYGTAASVNDIYMMAVDRVNDEIYWGRNGVWFDSSVPDTNTSPAYSSVTAAQLFFAQSGISSSDLEWNFGASTFAYPIGASNDTDGYISLCTANLPTPAIVDPSQHYHVEKVDHDGTSTAFTLPWNADTYDTMFEIKNHNTAEKWYIVDGLNGYNKYTSFNSTAIQTTDGNVIGVSGTTITLGSTLAADVYSVTCYKAGLAGGVSNTDGTITSQVSVNTTSGFVIGKYAGNATVGANFGHGFTVVPDLVMIKTTDNASYPFVVQHKDVVATKYLDLSAGSAAATNSFFNSQYPTSSLIYVDNSNHTNTSSKNYLFYAWYGVEGYSKFDTYTGNASTDGAVVSLSFRPKRGFVKQLAGQDWFCWNTETEPYNQMNKAVRLSTTANETSTTVDLTDFLSNGFKLRHNDGAINNGSYVYGFFAEAVNNPDVSQVRAR